MNERGLVVTKPKIRRAWWVALIVVGALVAGLTPVLAGLRDDGPPAVRRDGYLPHPVPAAAVPSREGVAPLVDKGLHDAANVRMFRMHDQVWDHPVAQAQWGLQNLAGWRATGKRIYLDRAIANAQRNVDRRVESRGAWWYPYDFELARCKKRPLLRPRWYSGMSQGQLLSLFVGLYEETGDAAWRTAADRTFLSLTLPVHDSEPWATWTDRDGYQWLEEYPENDDPRGEQVLNGHVFSLYGVYDYWRMTGDGRAAEVFDAAATTVRRYLPTRFRVENWASRYSMNCRHFHLKYHQIHTRQTLRLYEITHASVFAEYADTLRADYPAPALKGTVQLERGTHVGYTFDLKGQVTGERTVTLAKAARVAADQRIRVRGRGIHYRVTEGPLAGYLVPEEPGRRVLLGVAVDHRYAPARALTAQPGTYTGFTFDRAGAVTGTRKVTFADVTELALGGSAWVNGELSYQVAAGELAGFWLAARGDLAVASAAG
ncbi:D-glucuronyl C5-epimerase family protein [Micromonospora maritima]|uniref:D-glucuronyl C5-epimerase family protein n=1 Tax=Micromonospora maritima TaxID=986711 RepID=UPI0037997071